MKLAGKTDVGCVRVENQDDFRAGELPDGAAWALVCDGMGGAQGGREAAHCACDIIESCFSEQYERCAAVGEEEFLKSVILAANHFVLQKSILDESLAGMGTTAVCALARGGKVHLCHVGDSRAYLYRAGELRQITHDHSYVQELVDGGVIPPAEAEHHPQKNIITRAVGVDDSLEPEYTVSELKAGDIYLLCSDGLSNMIPPEQLALLLGEGDFYDMPDRLIETAKINGGADNVTAVLMAAEPAEVQNG